MGRRHRQDERGKTNSSTLDLDPFYGSGRNRMPMENAASSGTMPAAVSRGGLRRSGPSPHMKILSPLMPL